MIALQGWALGQAQASRGHKGRPGRELRCESPACTPAEAPGLQAWQDLHGLKWVEGEHKAKKKKALEMTLSILETKMINQILPDGAL